MTEKNIIFAVPGSKVYISRYYSNHPNSFLNISLTGQHCELLCKHCRALLLKEMVDINAYENPSNNNRILKIIDNFGRSRVNGILLSGGFDKKGRLPFDSNIINEIKAVKKIHSSKIRFYMHLGFISSGQTEALNGSGIDGVFVNVISDKNSIENIYNMPDIKPEDFYENIKLMKKAGLKVSPHLIIGLNEGKITEEYNAIEELSKLQIDSLVFVVVKNLYSGHHFTESIDIEKISGLFSYAKKMLPGVPMSLGCARPPGKFSEEIEIELLKKSIDIISFPSDSTIRYAEENNFSFKFEELCCAFPGS